jgi:hypothetical protein
MDPEEKKRVGLIMSGSVMQYALGILASILAAGIVVSGFGQPAPEMETRWAILVSGVSGDPELQKEYAAQLKDMDGILERQFGFPRDHIFALFDDPSQNPSLFQYKSTREDLAKVCRNLAAKAQKGDLLFVLILGHGSMDSEEYKLNLVGPDPTAKELAAMLDEIPAQRSIVVNTTNCSGGSIPALSRSGRVLITATKSGVERNQTRFAEFFIEGFKENRADTDKDGRVSMLEAFRYANQAVEGFYSKAGNLQTEHAQLDDDGDAQAHAAPGPDNGDGLFARTSYLDRETFLVAGGNLTPEQSSLAREAESLQKQIEALKYAKSSMPEAEYEKKLEDLLVRLAQVNAKLRKK